MSEPFEPPSEGRRESQGAVAVVGIWALTGATAGTSLGITLQLTGQLDTGGASLGIGCMAGFAVLGALAFKLERSWARSRPEVLDGRGRSSRPLHGALYAVPIVIAMPAVLWLMVAGSVGAGSIIPAMAFGVAAVGMAWAANRIWSTHRLTRALEALELGREEEATAVLRVLEASPLVSKKTRIVARLNLGTLALQQGRLSDAARWLAGIEAGQAGAHARAGMALIRILQGELDQARYLIAQAMSGRAARAVQAQTDAVRILIVLGEEGEAAALEFGERLLGQTSSGLHLALIGAMRQRAGRVEAAHELLTRAPAIGILQSGLAREIPLLEGM